MPDINESNVSQEAESGSQGLSSLAKQGARYAFDKLGGKQALKKIAQKVGEKAVKDGIATAIATGFWGTIGTFFLPIIIVFLVIMIVPVSLLGANNFTFNDDNTKATEIKDKVKVALENSYNNSVLSVSTRNAIVREVNNLYGCSALSDNGIVNNDGSFHIATNTCDITVSFNNDMDTIVGSISAYTIAVNSTISSLGDELYKNDEHMVKDENGNPTGEYKIPEDMPNISDSSNYIKKTDKKDENGLPIYEYSNNIEGFMNNAFNNEYADASSEEFAERIKKESSSFFEVEVQSTYWLNNVIETEQTEIKKACYMIYDETTEEEVYKEVALSNCDEAYNNGDFQYKEKQTVNKVYKGLITIPIYFDATDFGKDRLDEIKEEIFGKNMCPLENGTTKCDSKKKTETLVNTLLNSYYQTALEELRGERNGNNTPIYIHPTSSRGLIAGFDDIEKFDLNSFLNNIDNSKYYRFAADGINGSYNVCSFQNNIGWPYSNCARLSSSRSFNKMICSSFASSRYWEVNYPNDKYPLPSNWDAQLTYGNYSSVDTSKIYKDVNMPIPQAIMGIRLSNGGLHALFIESVGADGSVIVSECNWSGNVDSAWNENGVIASSYSGRSNQTAVYGFKIKKYSSLRQCLIEHGNATLIYMYGR